MLRGVSITAKTFPEDCLMQYDHIVLGAGSAGAIVATRLSEDPQRSVLLIEAGPDYPTLEQLPDEVKHGYATATDIMVSDHNWQFVGKATDKAPEMMVPRGKVTGGSSAINGQVFLRGGEHLGVDVRREQPGVAAAAFEHAVDACPANTELPGDRSGSVS